MNIKAPLIITNAATLSDGGTKYLTGIDNNKNDFSILIAQYVFPENFNDHQIPGRLHFNEKPIDIRSSIENDIIHALENCIVRIDTEDIYYSKTIEIVKGSENLIEASNTGDHYGIAYLIKHFIDIIKSDNYIDLAKKFKTKL